MVKRVRHDEFREPPNGNPSTHFSSTLTDPCRDVQGIWLICKSPHTPSSCPAEPKMLQNSYTHTYSVRELTSGLGTTEPFFHLSHVRWKLSQSIANTYDIRPSLTVVSLRQTVHSECQSDAGTLDRCVWLDFRDT